MNRFKKLLYIPFLGMLFTNGISIYSRPPFLQIKKRAISQARFFNDKMMGYMWKKTPVRIRTAIENSIEKYQKGYANAQKIVNNVYPYKYYLMGGLGLLALAGYNRAAIARKFGEFKKIKPEENLEQQSVPPVITEPEPVSTHVKLTPIETTSIKTFFNIDTLPDYIKQHPLFQFYKKEYDKDLAENSKYFARVIQVLKRELSNPVEKDLFCVLVNQFDKDFALLNLNFINTYSDNPNLFILSQHEQIRELLAPPLTLNFNPKEDFPSIYYLKNNLGVDDIDYSRAYSILTYAESISEVDKTFFGDCGRSSLALSDMFLDNRKIFEGVAYKLIKMIAYNPQILSQLKDRTILFDLPERQLDLSKPRIMGVELQLNSSYKGKNKLGKMVTYAVQQLLLSENHELLKAIVKNYYQAPTKMFSRKDLPFNVGEIIIEYRGAGQ